MKMETLPPKAREKLIGDGYTRMTQEERISRHEAAMAELREIPRSQDDVALEVLRRIRGRER